MGTTPPQATASLPPNGGNGVIRTTTRRRHADSQLLVVQNPHRSQPRALRCIQDRRRVNYFALAPPSGRAGRQISRTGRSDVARLKPMTPLRPLMQTNVKPPSPLLAPEQEPLKPPSPLQPKYAPKTTVSHPQRRWWFQLGLSLREQRRRRFQTTAHLACGLQLRHQQVSNSHVIRSDRPIDDTQKH